MSARVPLHRRRPSRRAVAALAAAGLPVAALAAGPPALPAPAGADWAADAPAAEPPADLPSLPAPGRLDAAFEAADPLPAPRRDWSAVPGFEHVPSRAKKSRDSAETAGTNRDDRPAGTRGWLSFRPARVRPVSGLSPSPDPQYSGGFDGETYGGPPGGVPYGVEPAPAPLPGGPPARFDDFPAPGVHPGAFPDQSFPAPDAGFAPVPRSSNYAPNAYERAPYAPPVRDLRTPEPPPFPPYAAPPAPYAAGPYAPEAVGGVPFAAGFPPAGRGIGAGLGAGPVADLAVAGGMCDLDGCGLPLFGAVRIEDRRNISPRAVRRVIAVADPRLPAPPHGLAKLFRRVRFGREVGPECDPCDLGGDALVFVEVCVPDCRPEEVKVTRSGRRVHLDYGEYEVTLTARDGYVHVDYDD